MNDKIVRSFNHLSWCASKDFLDSYYVAQSEELFEEFFEDIKYKLYLL